MSEPKSKKTAKRTSTKILREFFCDCTKPEMIYGSLIRSPVASGKITNITIKDFPEGYYLYTARDIPGENRIQTFNAKNRVFCNETVHYLGEPAGIVVGPDQELTRKLASQVQITFDITTIDSALHEISEQFNRPVIDFPKRKDQENEITALAEKLTISPSLDSLPKTNENSSYTKPEQISKILSPKNRAKKTKTILAKRILQTGAFNTKLSKNQLNAIFRNSFHEFASEWTFSETSDDFSENLGALAKYENGKISVVCPTRWQNHLQKSLSSILDIPQDKIDVKSSKLHDVNQNGLHQCTIIAAAAAIASMHSGLPVKLELTKEEQKLYYDNALQTKLSYRTGLSQDGKIESMMVHIETDAGYTNPFAQEIADRLTIAASSLYSQPNLYIESVVVSSNKAPTTMNPKQIDSAAFFGIENHLNYIAKKTGLLPFDLRILNFDSVDSVFNFPIDKKLELINKMTMESGFSRKFASYRLNIQNHTQSESIAVDYIPKRGIGMSVAFQGNVFYGTNFPNENICMELILNMDGSATIISPIAPATIVDSWKKIVSDMLEFENQTVKIETTIDDQEDSYPVALIKSSGLLTMLLKKCCLDIQKKRFRSPLPLTAKKTLSSSLKKNWHKDSFTGTPYFAPSFVSVTTEIEINPLKYNFELKKLYVFFNCGEIISPSGINSSMQLSVQKELAKLGITMPLDKEHFLLRYAPSNQNSGQINSLIHNSLPAALTSALSMALSKDITEFPIDQKIIFDLLKPQGTLQNSFNEGELK
ncbi:MAG: molybdopterin cofactor-binding domain-containing protein [Treponema sp.]|nr:molybdopterin cofactor-binding domain-containing protein [Treponema sp.]